MPFKKILCALTLTGLAACGGGGIGAQFAPVGSGPITVAEAQRWADEFSALDDLTSSDISLAVPTANATYNGLVQMEQTVTDYYLGRISLNADFSANTVSGQAGDFQVVRDTTPVTATDTTPLAFDTLDVLSGTLPVTAGTISTITQNGETASGMTATMAGNLSGTGGTHGFDTSLEGYFFSVAGQDSVGGLVSGTVTAPGSGATTADGVFVAFK